MLPAMGSLNAAALKAIRELQEPRMTQEALAKLVGIEQSYYSKIEHGIHKPRPPLIRALAEHLGVSIGAITNPHAECPSCAERAA
jgi:transcriptional regulator with XRE-family HTH domain